MLRAPNEKAGEKILVFGNSGTGKSTAWLTIADMAQKTKSPAHFYVLDTDNAIESRMLGQGFPHLNNVTVFECFEWTQYKAAMEKVCELAQPHDWVIVDLVSQAWTAVQDYFTQEVFHKGMGDYFLEVRKTLAAGAQSLGALSGWTDFIVINGLYNAWVAPLLIRPRFNVYTTAESKMIRDDEKDKSTKLYFGPLGVKPAGQKNLPFQHHTVLLSSEPRSGEYVLTTIKDRVREKLNAAPWTNFATDYLVKVGGWSLKAPKAEPVTADE